MSFTRISLVQAAEMLSQPSICLADIRDPASFNAGHVEGAYHLTNDTLPQFVSEIDKSIPVMVMCYHGNSSQGAANYLASLGYSQVYSVDGGFEAWKLAFPYVTNA